MLVFDGDCGFCTSCVNVMTRWIRPAVDVGAWQDMDLNAVGLTSVECAQALQFVDDDGTISSGSRAVTGMLRTAPRPWPWIAAVADAPIVRRLADVTYRVVARNRSMLPGATPACAVRDQAPAPDSPPIPR